MTTEQPPASRPRSRLRRLVLGVVAAALLLGGAVAGFWITARAAPERLRALAEAWISELVGPVRVDAVGFGFHWGPAVDLYGVRTLPAREAAGKPDGAAGTAEEPAGALSVERIRVSVDLPSLLRGQIHLGRVEASGLRADLVRTAEGDWRPPAVPRLLERTQASRPATSTGEEVLAALRRAAARAPRLVVDDASLRLRTLDGHGAVERELGLDGLGLSLVRSRLSGDDVLTADARLEGAGAERGGLELRVELPRLGKPSAELSLSDLDLAALAPWIAPGAASAAMSLAGRGAAHLTWGLEKGVQQGAVELVVLDLRVAGAHEALHLTAPSARASARYALSGKALDLSDLRVSLHPLRIDGRIRAARPFHEASHLAVSLHGAPVGAVPLRSFLLDLGLADAPRRFAEALTDGQLAAWSLRWRRASLAGARALAADPLGAWPDDLEVTARVEGVGARIAGSSEPLRDLSGSVRVRRDQIELHDVGAYFGDDPLPQLDLSVTGVAAVLHTLQSGAAPPPVPPLPGWLALDEWVQAQREPGAPSRWKRARIDLDWLDHPVLLRPVEDLHATLFPAEPGIRAEDVTARWGDTRVAGHVRMSGPPPRKLDVQVEARPAEAGHGQTARRADPAAWTRGRFSVDLEKLGPLRADRVTGRLRVEGTRAAIRDGDGSIVPRGRLSGDVDLELDHRDHVPVDARLQLADASVPDLIQDLKLGEGAMTGTADLSGRIAGRLVAGVPPIAELEGPVDVRLHDGQIHRRLNLMLAIAAASDTLNPFRSRDMIPYDRIDGKVRFDHGILRTDSLSLTGPAVRMVATGSVDALHPPHELQAVVGLFFFKTLDTVISHVPIVNRLILGNDDNLVAAYFALTGPWESPNARVIPVKSILSPASIVTEGLPGFVRSGFSTLQRLLGVQSSEPRTEVPPPPPAGSSPPPAAVESREDAP